MLRTPVNNLICLFSCKWLLLKPCLEIWLKSILIWTAHDCFRLWLTDLLSIWQFQGMTQYCLWVERNWGHKGLKQLVGWRLAGSWTVGEAEAWGKASQDTQSPHQLGLLTRPSRPTHQDQWANQQSTNQKTYKPTNYQLTSKHGRTSTGPANAH